MGYVRVSGAKQEMSPAVQTRNLLAWANGREIQIFTELDVSAKLQDFEKRPEARRLLGQVEPGDWVVATKLDRFFRRGAELEFVERMHRYGVEFYPILESLGDRTTAMGELMELIRIGFAQFESHLISDRTREAMAHQREHGLPLTGKPPYGKMIEHFTLEEHGKRGAYFTENKEELKVIEEAAMRRMSGETCKQIATLFCQRGLHTTVWSNKRGEWCKWTPVRVSRATRWYFDQMGWSWDWFKAKRKRSQKSRPRQFRPRFFKPPFKQKWFKPPFKAKFFKPPFKPKWFKGPNAKPREESDDA